MIIVRVVEKIYKTLVVNVKKNIQRFMHIVHIVELLAWKNKNKFNYKYYNLCF